jgi:alkylation response protein AidB-like acyl-CoA dehydrogenase
VFHRRAQYEGILLRNDSRENGIRAGNTGYFSLQDVRVPQENMVGEEGEGFKIAMFALEQGPVHGGFGRHGYNTRLA